MDVVVVEAKISDAVLDESPATGEDVRLVRLQHLLHQPLRSLVLRPLQPLLVENLKEKIIDYLSVLQIKTKIVSCRTANSKLVKQEVNSTVTVSYTHLTLPTNREV